MGAGLKGGPGRPDSRLRAPRPAPFEDAALGQRGYAQLAEHVESLGAVVGAVGGGVDEDGGARVGVDLVFAGALEGLVERAGAGVGREIGGGLFDHREELVDVSLHREFDRGALRAPGEDIGRCAVGADDVEDGVVERAEADREAPVELLACQAAAGVEKPEHGPAVLGEEDVDGVGGVHSFASVTEIAAMLTPAAAWVRGG